MKDFKHKLFLFKKIKNISVCSVFFIIFIYIGIQPFVESLAFVRYAVYLLVIIGIAFVFFYESKFSAAERFIEETQLQIDDAGYYLTSRDESGIEDFSKALIEDLNSCGFKIDENSDSNGLSFDFTAVKGIEYIYCVKLEKGDRNDVIAYCEEAKNDLLSNKFKRKGECVVFFICDDADESAVALSKSFTRVFVSRYNVIIISPVIIEPGSKKVYFLGNRISRTQKLVSEFAMNCELPIKDKYICFEKLKFQKELEEKMKDFNLADFKSGKFYER